MITKDILEEMARMGQQVTIITGHFDGLPHFEILNGVAIFRVPVMFRKKMQAANIASMLSYFPSSVFSAIKKYQDTVYDVMNTHFAIPSGPTGYVLSKLYKIPNVLSIHGGDIYDPSKRLSPHKTPLLYQTVRFMLNSAHRVVAQSTNTKNNAITYYHIDRSIDIVPLGIKKPTFSKMNREAFGFKPEDKILCTVGRLVKRKNIDDLLLVIAEIKNTYPCKLIVVGDGPEKTHILEMVQQLGIAENIIMAGSVTDEEKYQLMTISDCFVSTATHEGFGLVFLEAMETGKPVICYDHGGQTDFLVNGKTGFVVHLGDRQGVKQKILEIISATHTAEQMGRFNKNLVQKYYIEKCAENYLSIFNEAIRDLNN